VGASFHFFLSSAWVDKTDSMEIVGSNLTFVHIFDVIAEVFQALLL
jgi:hypothetical protein